jgi:hypothetical protein
MSAERASGAGPALSDADALADRMWFDQHPRRRYRARPGWLIRRRGSMMLRTPTSAQSLPPDNEDALRAAWARAAWPSLTPAEHQALLKTIRATEPQR